MPKQNSTSGINLLATKKENTQERLFPARASSKASLSLSHALLGVRRLNRLSCLDPFSL